ncbi:hypothetical protein MEA186_05591 [Mesorhizobium amorphae CCNWGS0123]|uniref:Uncharacterized protein n=1 Tax=Mesorhizobium amorphae CCNWGS0123 TaxID=1082933 RepID=G6Y5A9_9HYPH|nr:hypothetical protein MEA186_05591 [Mesorhizobium amorphae CCNWGS0123]
MPVFFVDVTHVVQYLLTSWLRMRPVKLIPFEPENDLVQKVI